MFAIFSPRYPRRAIDAGRVGCPLRRRDVDADLCAGCGWAHAIELEGDTPCVHCTAELVRALPDTLLV